MRDVTLTDILEELETTSPLRLLPDGNDMLTKQKKPRQKKEKKKWKTNK